MGDRTELKAAIRAGEGKLPRAGVEINGKAFVEKLDKCKTPDEIFALLTESMDKEKLTDRVKLLQKNFHDNDLIVAMESNKARCNVKLGFRTSHEALVVMAVGKFKEVTGGKPGHNVEEFKRRLALYTATHSPEKTDAQKIAAQLIAKRGR